MGNIKDNFFAFDLSRNEVAISKYVDTPQYDVLTDSNSTIFKDFSDTNVYEEYCTYLQDIYNNKDIDLSNITNPNLVIYEAADGYIWVVAFDNTEFFFYRGGNNYNKRIDFGNSVKYRYKKSTGDFDYMGGGGTLTLNPFYIFTCSCPISYRVGGTQNPTYSYNYLYDEGVIGKGSGGWRPVKKIMLNGVNYSDTNPEDPNYNWYYNDDKTLIVRESKADSSFRWYFNDFAVTARSSPFQTVPSNLQSFIKNGVGVECSVSSGEQSVGYIGFHDNTIRLWNTGWGSNFTGICKGIMESTDTAGASHTWEEPNMPTVKIIKLNGVTPDKIMLNGVCYFENELPPKQTLVRLDYTNNDHPTSNISVNFSDADDNMAIDNFFLDLKSYRFAGSYSTAWNSNVTLNSYSTANKTLSMSWGTMSGSSQQNFDIVEVPDPTRLTVLQDWTVINQGTTLEINLPSAYASRITTDDILIDFKEIHTYESLNGGSWITISRAIQNGKLVLTIPDYFATNSYYSIRVLCSL